MFKKLTTIAVTVIITATLSFFTFSAYYNGKLLLKPDGYGQLQHVDNALEKYYYKDYSKDVAMDGAIKGYVDALGDPYTEYMNEEDVKEFNKIINSSYCGIGVSVQYKQDDNTLLVIDVFNDSPAEKAGIVSGDVIIAVDGVNYVGEQLEEATSAIQGEEDTQVTVTVRRESGDVKDFKIIRKSIVIDTVESQVMDGNIGYISVSQFSTNTAMEFTEQLDELTKKNIKGLVVDVRDNGGGLTTAASAIADCLLPKGAVIYFTADKYDNKEYVKSKIDGIEIPVVVLANENSASASEILVGAIKDNNRGVIVGEKTFGKGVVQQVLEMPGNAALKVTAERYFTPSGAYIHEKGIEPDYKVELQEDVDTQLEKALEILKNQ